MKMKHNNKPTKKEMKEYIKMLEREAKKFKLTKEDLSNLYDLFYMIDNELYETLKLNKMDKWVVEFHQRIERIVIPEIYEDRDELVKLVKEKIGKIKRNRRKSRNI